MQLARLGQAFDSRDLRAIGLDGEARARLHRNAVEQYRTRTALTGVAADFGTG
jgi:hypothetical protein